MSKRCKKKYLIFIMIDKFAIILIIFALLIGLIVYFQMKNNKNENKNKIEGFTSDIENKLFIKKTDQFKLIHKNSKYCIWIPLTIDNYYPIGCYATKKNIKPDFLVPLVKNEVDNEAKDKPEKFEIISISTNNNAFWKPIPKSGYVGLGLITSVDYPSKFIIRCVPEKFTKKTNIEKNIAVNKLNETDEGYELWSLKHSSNFIINNLNNINNPESLENQYALDLSKCSIEKQLYIKYTTKYEKIANYKDKNTNQSFTIWKPIPPQNFNIVGYLCLNNSKNPNKKIKSIVVHNSCTKPPVSYGKNNIIKLDVDGDGDTDEVLSFWRPKPPDNYFCLGDILVKNNEEPDSDNLIHCISLDYAETIQNPYKMIWNNINNKNSASIWNNNNNFFSISNGYEMPKNMYSLNNEYMYSDNDLLDDSKTIILKYKKNKNIVKEPNIKDIQDDLRKTLAFKLDINEKRIKNIIVEDKFITLTFESKLSGTKQLKVINILSKLDNILNMSDIKLYDEDKSNYYYTLYSYTIKDHDKNTIMIDNSLFENKYN